MPLTEAQHTLLHSRHVIAQTQKAGLTLIRLTGQESRTFLNC